MPNEVFSFIETLVRRHYENLSSVTGCDGWYSDPGSVFRRVLDGFVVELSLDGGISKEAMADHLRSLAVEVKTSDLIPALDVFATLATRYFEGKPVGFDTSPIYEKDVTANFPTLKKIPPHLSSSDIAYRGNVHDVRKAIVEGRVEFRLAYILEVPRSEGATLWGDDLTGRTPGPTIYRVTHGLFGSESRIVDYARDLDNAIQGKR